MAHLVTLELPDEVYQKFKQRSQQTKRSLEVVTTHISNQLRNLVINRANFHCEYCLLHQDDEPIYPHEVDHVIAEKHSGQTQEKNLAYACFYCNRFKGTDLASLDPLNRRNYSPL